MSVPREANEQPKRKAHRGNASRRHRRDTSKGFGITLTHDLLKPLPWIVRTHPLYERRLDTLTPAAAVSDE